MGEKTGMVIAQILGEREKQERLGWDADHDDKHDQHEWRHLRDDYEDKAITALDDERNEIHRRRLLQIAAITVAQIEAFDRNKEYR